MLWCLRYVEKEGKCPLGHCLPRHVVPLWGWLGCWLVGHISGLGRGRCGCAAVALSWQNLLGEGNNMFVTQAAFLLQEPSPGRSHPHHWSLRGPHQASHITSAAFLLLCLPASDVPRVPHLQLSLVSYFPIRPEILRCHTAQSRNLAVVTSPRPTAQGLPDLDLQPRLSRLMYSAPSGCVHGDTEEIASHVNR